MNVQITGWIDQGLNEKAYIVPGLGDFGERRQGSRSLQTVSGLMIRLADIALERRHDPMIWRQGCRRRSGGICTIFSLA